MVNPAYLIGAGAVVGALFRYGTKQYVDDIANDRVFSYGTFTVNVVGSFVLALVTFLGMSDTILYIVGIGACGSYTTFSSFSVDTIQLWEGGEHLLAVWYAAANLLGALVAIGLALGLTSVAG